jgi:hypothetical protein
LIIHGYSSNVLNSQDILNFKPELLAASFKMYIGEPQPLWWIGTHHRGEGNWSRVIELIALMPSHSLFQIAFNVLLSNCDRKQLCIIINSIGGEHIEEIFELMLRYNIEYNPEFMPEVWRTLFDLSPEPGICSVWIERIAQHSSNILDGLYQAREFIPNNYLNEFYSHFISDVSIMKFLKKLEQFKDEHAEDFSGDLRDMFIPRLKVCFKDTPPKHYDTCNHTQRVLARLGYSAKEIQFVEDIRKKLIDKKEIMSVFEESEKITDWIF